MSRCLQAAVVLMTSAFYLMFENLVYAARYGREASPVLWWTIPGAVAMYLVGCAAAEIAAYRAKAGRDEE